MRRFRIGKTKGDISICLRRLATTAAKRFPYYRDLMREAGVKPRHLTSVETLRRLPVTTKTDVLTKLWEGFRHRSLPNVDRVKWSTSGTSGPLLLIHMNTIESTFRTLSYYKAVKGHVALSRPLTIVQLGAGARESKKEKTMRQRLIGAQITRICRLLPVEEQLARLLDTRPQIITGSPSCLEAVAARMVESHVVKPVGLVVCRGEVLDEETRTLLGKAFNAKVADFYNTEEVGNVASECPADPKQMHVNTDCCILEIVDERGDPATIGTEGRVVVTNLFNHTMPFIRYDLRDRGTLLSAGGSLCECGSRRPTMLPPLGRSDDVFSFPFGLQLSPRSVESLVAPTLLRLLRAESPLSRGAPAYQIIQEAESQIRILIEGSFPLRRQLAQKVEVNFRNMGIAADIIVEEVDEIRVPESGKPRRVVSKLQTAPQ